MEPPLPEQYPWLQFATELPPMMVFLALLGASGGIIFVGHLIKGVWDRKNETVPIPVAIIMNIVMLFAYAFVVRKFYDRTPEPQQISLLAWCFIFLAPTAFYYGRIVAVSFSNRVIDQISPFNMRIEEPSEFAEARKLALRGDVDGAVKRYRAYLDNTDTALFEAARLLKSEDRFAEAAALFQEISERYFGKKLVWAEASFNLAKLRELHLHQAQDAMLILGEILVRVPDTRYGQLAQTELTRMQTLYTADIDAPRAYVDPEGIEDPFYSENHLTLRRHRNVTTADNGRAHLTDPNELPAPPVDPFFAAAMQRAKEDEIEEAAAKPARKKKPTKKPAAKKRPAKRKAKSSE